MSIVLSVIFLLILLFAVWGGYKRGLILSVAQLVAIVASLYLACLLSAAFSGELVTALRPFAAGYVEGQIDKVVMPELGLSESGLSVTDALAQNPEQTDAFCTATYRAVGIASGPAQQLSQEAQTYADEQKVSVTDAITEVLCTRISYVGGVVLCFIVILILLLAIGNLPNLTFRIPEKARLDDVGGAVCGGVCGAAYCVLLCWALQFLGLLIGRDTMENCLLARLFLAIDFLTLGVGI